MRARVAILLLGAFFVSPLLTGSGFANETNTSIEQNRRQSLIEVMISSKSPAERTRAVAAARRILADIEQPDDQASLVLAAAEAAPARVLPEFVRLLGYTRSQRGLDFATDLIQSSNRDLREAAISTISEWPNTDAVEALVEVVRTTRDKKLQQQAVIGFARLASQSDTDEACFDTLMSALRTDSQKRMVLSGLGHGRLRSPLALDFALHFLQDRELSAVAGQAAFQIARRIQPQNETLARNALETIAESETSRDVRLRAQEALNELDKYKDHIVDWVAIGPFGQRGLEAQQVYHYKFAPELRSNVPWAPLTQGIGDWEVDLQATFGRLDHCAVYVKTRVWAEENTEAAVELGADDAVKVWLNNHSVYQRWSTSNVEPRQLRLRVRLRRGWNDLVLKVVDRTGDWGYCCRIRELDGSKIDGLRVEAR